MLPGPGAAPTQRLRLQARCRIEARASVCVAAAGLLERTSLDSGAGGTTDPRPAVALRQKQLRGANRADAVATDEIRLSQGRYRVAWIAKPAARLSTCIAGAEQCSRGVAHGGVPLWLLRAAAGLLISVGSARHLRGAAGPRRGGARKVVTTTINHWLWR